MKPLMLVRHLERTHGIQQALQVLQEVQEVQEMLQEVEQEVGLASNIILLDFIAICSGIF
jgi:hypothetical protein